MDWSDVLKLALSIFLIVTGLGLAYLFLRMAGGLPAPRRLADRITDEVVPILNQAQTTVDGVNLELARVDEIMKTAVGATKGAEKTVQTVSTAVTAPVRKLTGLAAGVREAVATLRAPRGRGGRPGPRCRRRRPRRRPAGPSPGPGGAAALATAPPPHPPAGRGRRPRRRPRPRRPAIRAPTRTPA